MIRSIVLFTCLMSVCAGLVAAERRTKEVSPYKKELTALYKEAYKTCDFWTALQVYHYGIDHNLKFKNPLGASTLVLGQSTLATPTWMEGYWDRGDRIFYTTDERLSVAAADGRPTSVTLKKRDADIQALSADAGHLLQVTEWFDEDNNKQMYSVYMLDTKDGGNQRLVHRADLSGHHHYESQGVLNNDGRTYVLPFERDRDVKDSQTLCLVYVSKKLIQTYEGCRRPRAVGPHGKWLIAEIFNKKKEKHELYFVTDQKSHTPVRSAASYDSNVLFQDVKGVWNMVKGSKRSVWTAPIVLSPQAQAYTAGDWLAVASGFDRESKRTVDMFGNEEVEEVYPEVALYHWPTFIADPTSEPYQIFRGSCFVDENNPHSFMLYNGPSLDRLRGTLTEVEVEEEKTKKRKEKPTRLVPTLIQETVVSSTRSISGAWCHASYYRVRLVGDVSEDVVYNCIGRQMWHGPSDDISDIRVGSLWLEKHPQTEFEESGYALVVFGESEETNTVIPVAVPAGLDPWLSYDFYGRFLVGELEEEWLSFDPETGALLGRFPLDTAMPPIYGASSGQGRHYLFSGKLIEKATFTDRESLSCRLYNDAAHISKGLVQSTEDGRIFYYDKRRKEHSQLAATQEERPHLVTSKTPYVYVNARKTLIGVVDGKGEYRDDMMNTSYQERKRPEGMWQVDYSTFRVPKKNEYYWKENSLTPFAFRSHVLFPTLLVVTPPCIIEITGNDMSSIIKRLDYLKRKR